MNLFEHIINLFQFAMGMDLGGTCGTSELVVRERIQHDRRITPTIYDGLPLRPEFRVFYDFDRREPIFIANYWEYDYIRNNNGLDKLYDLTDKIVFDYMREPQAKKYEEKKDEILQLVADHMQGVQGLAGPWSIDIMLTERDHPYLIDKAVAEQSAYWEFRPGNEVALAAQLAEERAKREAREKRTFDLISITETE